MKSLLFTILFLTAINNINYCQRLQVTTKDTSVSEITVKSFTTRILTTSTGGEINYRDILSVMLIDYNYGRDNDLVKALQAAGVKVAMGKPDLVPQKKLPASDSLRIAILEARLDNVQINTGKFHQQHQTGTWIAIAGLAVSVISVAAGNNTSPNAGVYVGAGMTVLGGVVAIDSYKYLKRASQR